MRNNSVLLFVFILLSVNVLPAFCSEDAQLIEIIGNGSINWTEGIIRAQGTGSPPEWAFGKPQARPLALTRARMVAYKNLLKTVQGIRVNASSTIQDTTAKDPEAAAQLDSMVRGAEVISEEYRPGGTVNVMIQMSMTGGFFQLILPDDILHVESVKTIRTFDDKAGAADGATLESFTGLVVDARGLDIRPAIVVRILNENGKEIYGSAFVSREHAVQQGMCVYLKDIERAVDTKRVGKHPLVVKGIKTQGMENSDIVVSNADAAVLKSSPNNLSFLRKCFVAVIVD